MSGFDAPTLARLVQSDDTMMTRDPQSPRSSALQTTLLRWELVRGHDRLVCQVKREHHGQFAVAVGPTDRVRWSSVQTFQKVALALRRHATVVSQLRASGWRLVSYTA